MTVWADRVTILHPETGHVIAVDERANVTPVTTGLVTDSRDGSVIGAVRDLSVMLTPATAYRRGYKLRWAGMEWTPRGELLPIHRRGRLHHWAVPVQRVT